MTTLKAFKSLNKQCAFVGCTKHAVKTKLPVKGKWSMCLRHQLNILSGRVGPNHKRDHYRQYLKGYCEISKKTWGQLYPDTLELLGLIGAATDRLTVVRANTRRFQVDHKDGNHSNNDPDNLQTVRSEVHKMKSDLMGDADPTRNKKRTNI